MTARTERGAGDAQHQTSIPLKTSFVRDSVNMQPIDAPSLFTYTATVLCLSGTLRKQAKLLDNYNYYRR